MAVPAAAETQSTTMPVSATIRNNCTVSATPMSFAGTVEASGTNIDGTASINVRCTASTSFNVVMDRGTNANGGQRRMVSENNRFLPYDVYSDASRSTEWGDGADGVVGQVEGAGSASLTAYGRISAVSLATESGNYRDTVTVTVNF